MYLTSRKKWVIWNLKKNMASDLHDGLTCIHFFKKALSSTQFSQGLPGYSETLEQTNFQDKIFVKDKMIPTAPLRAFLV